MSIYTEKKQKRSFVKRVKSQKVNPTRLTYLAIIYLVITNEAQSAYLTDTSPIFGFMTKFAKNFL